MTPSELAEIRATGERRIAERRAEAPALRDALVWQAGESAATIERLRRELANAHFTIEIIRADLARLKGDPDAKP